jgi:hypothetical protein
MDAAVFRSQIFHEYFTFYAMKMLSLFAALTLFRLFNSTGWFCGHQLRKCV